MGIGSMGIDIPCHICIRVSHQILQVLDCHSGIGRMPLPAGSCVTVLISKIFALALSCPKNAAFFYLFSLRTLSNFFPLWIEPELTGLFYHIQAPFSTAKYKNQTENAVSRYLSKARRFISRLEPVHKTYGQLSLLVKSRSLLMPMPK